MKVCVVGGGFVGTTVAACFARFGNTVNLVESDEVKAISLAAGTPPFYEPELDAILRESVDAGRLVVTTKEFKFAPDVVFLCVGTPSKDDGEADLSALLDAARFAAKEAMRHTANTAHAGIPPVVVKSTVPPGTHKRVRAALAESGFPLDCAVISNPEFLAEGRAVRDFCYPSRVVLGVNPDGHNKAAVKLLATLYSPLTKTIEITIVDNATAELAKYACNAMLAARISLMNEIAGICDSVGANVDSLRHIVGGDERIGPKFLFPGIGFGGSCFPKDLKALAKLSNGPAFMTHAILSANNAARYSFHARISEHFRTVAGRRIAVWGMAFKPNTDDTREAPGPTIARNLIEAGATVHVHDPRATCPPMPPSWEGPTPVKFAHGEGAMYASAIDADAIVICTEWPEYQNPDFARLKASMRSPVIFDGRNCVDPDAARDAGFLYFGVGR